MSTAEYEDGVIWTGARRHLTRGINGVFGARQAICNRNTFTYPLEKVNRYRKTPVDLTSVPQCRVCLKKFPEWS